jgi:hypothetical protein
MPTDWRGRCPARGTRSRHLGGAPGPSTIDHGVDRSVIALWHGHESVETTVIYLQAEMKLKEQALAKTNATDGQAVRYKPDDNLLAFLKSL